MALQLPMGCGAKKRRKIEDCSLKWVDGRAIVTLGPRVGQSFNRYLPKERSPYDFFWTFPS